MKYKNKHGIELSYKGHKKNTSVQLVKEVLREAIKIGDREIYPNRPKPLNGWKKVRGFLKENFSL